MASCKGPINFPQVNHFVSDLKLPENCLSGPELKASPKRGTLFRVEENERVGYSRDEVFKNNCERVGKCIFYFKYFNKGPLIKCFKKMCLMHGYIILIY